MAILKTEGQKQKTAADRLKERQGKIRQTEIGQTKKFLTGGGGATLVAALQQLPFLQMLGGLIPELGEQMRPFLPEGVNFISPLEFGPFGSIEQQFDRNRALGRTSLAGRGLLGSGAEQQFNTDIELAQAMANRQAIAQLLQQIPQGLGQAQGQAFQNLIAKEQREGLQGGQGPGFGQAFGQLIGGFGQGAGMALPFLFPGAGGAAAGAASQALPGGGVIMPA
jgi:hypothetical protein